MFWARPGLWPGTALVGPNGPTGARLKPVSALRVTILSWGQARPRLAGLACRSNQRLHPSLRTFATVTALHGRESKQSLPLAKLR